MLISNENVLVMNEALKLQTLLYGPTFLSIVITVVFGMSTDYCCFWTNITVHKHFGSCCPCAALRETTTAAKISHVFLFCSLSSGESYKPVTALWTNMKQGRLCTRRKYTFYTKVHECSIESVYFGLKRQKDIQEEAASMQPPTHVTSQNRPSNIPTPWLFSRVEVLSFLTIVVTFHVNKQVQHRECFSKKRVSTSSPYLILMA